MIYSTHTSRPQALGLPGWQKLTINQWEAESRYTRKRTKLSERVIYTNQSLKLWVSLDIGKGRWILYAWELGKEPAERLSEFDFQRPLEAAIFGETFRQEER